MTSVGSECRVDDCFCNGYTPGHSRPGMLRSRDCGDCGHAARRHRDSILPGGGSPAETAASGTPKTQSHGASLSSREHHHDDDDGATDNVHFGSCRAAGCACIAYDNEFGSTERDSWCESCSHARGLHAHGPGAARLLAHAGPGRDARADADARRRPSRAEIEFNGLVDAADAAVVRGERLAVADERAGNLEAEARTFARRAKERRRLAEGKAAADDDGDTHQRHQSSSSSSSFASWFKNPFA
jgi:hypothetical protein